MTDLSATNSHFIVSVPAFIVTSVPGETKANSVEEILHVWKRQYTCILMGTSVLESHADKIQGQ